MIVIIFILLLLLLLLILIIIMITITLTSKPHLVGHALDPSDVLSGTRTAPRCFSLSCISSLWGSDYNFTDDNLKQTLNFKNNP